MKRLTAVQLLSEGLKQQSMKLAGPSLRGSLMPSKTTVRHSYGIKRTTTLQCVANICGQHTVAIVAY